MNKNSIFFSITLAFAALFIFILISFGVLYKGDEHREEFLNKKRSFDITQFVLKDIRGRQGITSDLIEYLEFMNFFLIKKKESILQDESLRLEWVNNKRKISIKRFRLRDKEYIYIKTHRNEILLLDANETSDFKAYLLVVLLFILIAFTLLYLAIINKLKPLGILKNKVKNFAEEEFDIECASDKKDEISQLSNEFDISAKKLKKIKESRNVFIRNIMHELKTPIAKGQFLTQLPYTDDNAQKMQKVFYRLESLINEFASIEELISTKKLLDKKEYFLSDIVDEALDLLMRNEDKVIQEFKNIKVNVDFKLFSIAVKNLLDNGIKYSSNKQIIIKTEGSNIIFENIGKELTHPFEEYFEAFFKSDKMDSRQSFGLGLYIVKHILDANNLLLEYEHKSGINRFIIIIKTQ